MSNLFNKISKQITPQPIPNGHSLEKSKEQNQKLLIANKEIQEMQKKAYESVKNG